VYFFLIGWKDSIKLLGFRNVEWMVVGGDEAEEVLRGTELASDDVTANNSQYSAILSIGKLCF